MNLIGAISHDMNKHWLLYQLHQQVYTTHLTYSTLFGNFRPLVFTILFTYSQGTLSLTKISGTTIECNVVLIVDLVLYITDRTGS